MRDHVHGGGDPDPVVHRGQQEGLGPSAGGSRAGQPALVHVRERLQEVHRADAVPQVQPQRPDPPLGEARVEQAVVHLPRVVVADHVPREDHVALPRERDAPRRDRPVGAVLEAAIGPVAVRREDPGKRTGLPERSVEVAGDVEPGMALEVDLLDGVVAPLDPAEDVRVERPLLRHRPQAGAHQDLLTQEPGPREPGLLVAVGREGVRRVQRADLDRAAIDPGDGLVLRARGERPERRDHEKKDDTDSRRGHRGSFADSATGCSPLTCSGSGSPRAPQPRRGDRRGKRSRGWPGVPRTPPGPPRAGGRRAARRSWTRSSRRAPSLTGSAGCTSCQPAANRSSRWRAAAAERRSSRPPRSRRETADSHSTRDPHHAATTGSER